MSAAELSAQRSHSGYLHRIIPVYYPRMTWKRTNTLFTAAEAAVITGVVQDEQRDFRKRGFLAPLDGGKAKFDAQGLAELLVVKILQERGVQPQRGWTLARSIGNIVYARLMIAKFGVSDPDNLANEPLVRTGPGSVAGNRWAVNEAADLWSFVDTPESLVDALGPGSIVLDLDRIAIQLVKFAPRPLALIERDI